MIRSTLFLVLDFWGTGEKLQLVAVFRMGGTGAVFGIRTLVLYAHPRTGGVVYRA